MVAEGSNGLPQILHHWVFEQRLSEEFLRAHRGGEPLSVIVLDVDLFKICNDLSVLLCGEYFYSQERRLAEPDRQGG